MNDQKQQLIKETEMAFDQLCVKISELQKLGIEVDISGAGGPTKDTIPSIRIQETRIYLEKDGDDLFDSSEVK